MLERGARAAKVERWTERLERYERSGQTAAELLPAASSATTIRFPNGIEMGSELRVADLLVKRLLENVEGGH